jgi:hypothetical protein
MVVVSRPISCHHQHRPETDVLHSVTIPPSIPKLRNDELKSDEHKALLKQVSLLLFSYVGYLLLCKIQTL